MLNVTSQLDTAISSAGYQTTPVPITSDNLDVVLSEFDPHEYIVFNWCESIPGIHHSEWLVTEYLEQKGFTFTGASSATIALTQDKCRIKSLLDRSGIKTPGWQLYNHPSEVTWNRFPAIVKPSNEHCSEGIDRNAVCFTQEELSNRVRFIIDSYCQPAMVEDFIDGRELHVSLWGNGRIDMLPPAEMEFSSFKDERDRLCSYEAKFIPESEQYQKINTVLPAPLSEEAYRNVERVCRSAYLVSGCRDYARIDMRLKNGIFYVIDVNPNSDISPDTSTILAADHMGYTYSDFGNRVIQLAAHRHPSWRNTFESHIPALPPCISQSSEMK
ncbi:MAG: ATP-grasp domain-containing protein [Dehalococcoidales bacterium]|nr:ATP-grasp domain-containing protein [Dehalococcoidales bacterium]